MMRILQILTLTFLTLKLFGQPGGGGGLDIGALYNKNLERININDSTFKFRVFALSDTSVNSKIIQELYLSNNFHLPPSYDIYQTDNYISLISQRLFLRYKNDTMIVDIHGIIPENGMGMVDEIDSIVFQPGHFRCFRNAPSIPENLNNAYNRIIYNGLTPFTIGFLSKITFTVIPPDNDTTPMIKRKFSEEYFKKLVERTYKQSVVDFSEEISTSFLSDKNLPATFYLRRGSYYVSQKKWDNAISDIYKSIELGLNRKEKEESLLLLCSAYSQMESYDKAIQYISDLIQMRSAKEYFQDNNEYNRLAHLKDNYKTRIELFINNRQFDKALTDYNSLVSVSKNYLDYRNGEGYVMMYDPLYCENENIERADFKMKYLKDYKGAVADLKGYIHMIQDKPEGETPQGVSSFNETYFTLALAEYYKGDLKSAFKHWLRAEELWYGYQNSSENILVHFDTLIQKHPKVPELYLARAIANYIRGLSFNGSEGSKNCFENSLKDIEKSKDLGLTDFRINMYTAVVLNAQKRYENALEQINIAISKKDNDPRLYINRYWIRDKLGQVKNRDQKTDPDWIKYTDLTKTWKFEK